MKTKLSMVQVIDAGAQSKRDAVAWLTMQRKHTGGELTDDEANAYEAGHRAGWRDAVAFLKLHGAVKLST